MNAKAFAFEAVDEAGTLALGRALAAVLEPGTIVALRGVLGAGKTRLVQATAEALGVDRRDVVSPTFVLVQQYQGRMPIYHVDAYRLRDEDEFRELGLEEYFAGGNVVFVEWADRFEGCLPPDRLDVEITLTGPNSRLFKITAGDRRFEHCLSQLGKWQSKGRR